MYFWQTRATNKFIRLYFIFPRLEYTIQNVLNATCYRSPSLDPWIIQGWKIHTSNYFVAMLNMNFTHSLPSPSRFEDKTPCSFDDFCNSFIRVSNLKATTAEPIIVKVLQKIGSNQSWIKLDGKFIQDLNGHWSLMSGILFLNPPQSFNWGTSNISRGYKLILWGSGNIVCLKGSTKSADYGWRKSGVSGRRGRVWSKATFDDLGL